MKDECGAVSRLTSVVRWAFLASAMGLGLWLSIDVVLVVFAGILLAIFLRTLSQWVSRHTPLSDGWSLATVTLGLLGILVGTGWLAAPDVAEQLDLLTKEMPRAVETLWQKIERYEWAGRLLDEVPSADELASKSGGFVRGATGALSTTAGAIAMMVVVLFIGLYLASNPQLYVGGFLLLAPIRHRARGREVMNGIGRTLQWWLLSKVIAMAVIGVATWAGLSLLGVPLALILGILAALLTFIPNLGPILSAIPAILLALMDGFKPAVYVALLYFGIQMVESYVLTPLLQQKTVSLPAALTMATQVLLGLLLGGLGVILATPLTAAGMVAVRMIYIEDLLGDEQKDL